MRVCFLCGARKVQLPTRPLETRLVEGVYEVVIAEAEERRAREAGGEESPTVRNDAGTEAGQDSSASDDGGAGGASHLYARAEHRQDAKAEQAAEVRTEGDPPEVEVGRALPATSQPGDDLHALD